jgi:hypothetical protein
VNPSRILLFVFALASVVRAQNGGGANIDRLDASQRQRVEIGFKVLDANVDGNVTREEFAKLGDFLPQVKEPARADLVFKLLDKNAEGSLSLDEYAGIMLLKPGGGAPASKPEPAPKPADMSVRVTPPTAEGIAFFEKNIRPVLVESCYKCHAADAEKIKGGLALDTREGIRKGGDTGPAIVPGDLAKSLLIEAIRYENEDTRMPPENKGGKLLDSVIANFEQWVKMGAPDPREGTAVAVPTSWDPEKAKSHWAYQPVKVSPPPAVNDANWARTDIDRFVLGALEAKGLKPVADAEPRALVRRLYFDLTGLPPSPEEVEAFVGAFDRSHESNETYGVLIDSLLSSKAFGERWGRHWLDVARYAESTGRDVNAVMPHAWRYRDYVIASFQADKPYNQFLREQIAGDLLPAKDSRERAQNLIATGFLALGSRNLNERNPRQFVLDAADEQIDTVSQAVLGLTAACARCHDHKFDPIPQRDYYALAGIFLSTETYYGTAPVFESQHPGKDIPLPGDAGLPSPPRKLDAAARAKLERDYAQAKKMGDQMFAGLYGGGRKGPEGGLNNDPKKLVQAVAITARIGQLQRELDAYDREGNLKPMAIGVLDLPPRGAAKPLGIPRNFEEAFAKFRERPADFRTPGDSPLYIRGDAAKPSDKVPRGFLSVLGATQPSSIATGQSGRRELAEWLVAPGNPLTARVFVNRAWHWLFGSGLVESVNNFGTTGQVPANPALLDYLARRFQEEGWSVKQLVREIVLSRSYQLSSAFDETNFTADPENALVWRHSPRRLEAEAIRDAMLAVSGSLQLDPPVGSAIAMAGEGSLGGRKIRYLQDPLREETFINAAGDFRSIYLPVPRNALPDALAVFDFAEPNAAGGDRDTTTVPVQALYLLNNEFAGEQAQRFATRLLALPAEKRVAAAFQLAFARPPTTAEQTAANELLAGFPSGGENAAWTSFCRALFGSAEFRILD